MMMDMHSFLSNSCRILEEASKTVQNAARELPPPEVYPLNYRTVTQICAAVAVDAGQNLFKGALQEAGIAIFQIASSLEDEEPRTVPFWVNPNLPDQEREKYIKQELDILFYEDATVQAFVKAMGWNSAGDALQPSQMTSAANVTGYVRDLLEWAELYRLARRLDEERKLKVTGRLQPILLRDGVLRFGSTAANVATPLGKLFQNLDIPIFGIGKRSLLLRMPVVKAWLTLHGVHKRQGPLCVWLNEEDFQKLGWHLERYFGGDGFRFGRYVLVRFDGLPGSRNFFAVDVPEYLYRERTQVLRLLSSVEQHISATAYPVPGYPLPLQIAHNKVNLRNTRAEMLERSIRTRVSNEAIEFLLNLDLGGKDVW